MVCCQLNLRNWPRYISLSPIIIFTSGVIQIGDRNYTNIYGIKPTFYVVFDDINEIRIMTKNVDFDNIPFI